MEPADATAEPPPVSAVIIEDKVGEDESSQRSARASRRERRAAEAEMKQTLEDMHKAISESGLPPLPGPGELPPLPAPGELPPLPSLDELPPLPDLPAPEIPVTCGGCESTFTARANKARRVKCPLCNETVKL